MLEEEVWNTVVAGVEIKYKTVQAINSHLIFLQSSNLERKEI